MPYNYTKPTITPEQAKSTLVNFKDRKFRKYQEKTIEYITNSSKKFCIVRSPCGSGKSLIAMVSGLIYNECTYLVQSKFLQNQITGDFPEAVSIFGKNNYNCENNPPRSCDECLASKTQPCSYECPYKTAKQRALESKLKILNFSYYILECQYSGRFAGSKFAVIDEADSLSDVLTQQVSLIFTERSLYRLNLENGPKFKTSSAKDGINSWIDFANEALYKSKNIYEQLQLEINLMDSDNQDYKLQKIREMKHFIGIAERCEIFLKNVDKDWRMEEVPRQGSRQGQLIFKPIWITPELADSFMWNNSQKWVLLSATYPPISVLCKQLGIDIDDVEDRKIYDVPSTFNPENAPVYVWPVASLGADRMNTETPKIINAVKKILERHPNNRGLIHCVSYKLGKEIVNGVKSNRLILHDSSNRQEILDMFANKNKPIIDNKVLVSPSAERGIDLADDLCRFIIIIKAPFKYLGDKVVSARVHGGGEIGKLWYISDMMGNVEQMCGRGVRSKDDYCSIYLLDQKIEDIYTSKPSLWSNSFNKQISWEDNKLI